MSGAEILPLVMSGVSAASTTGSMFSGSDASDAQVEALQRKRQANLLAAQEQSNAFEFERRGLERRATQIRTAAAADEAGRRRDLESSLQTIDVIRAGRGLSLESPTGRAISEGVRMNVDRDIMTAKANYATEAASSELAAALSGRKARYALLAGEMGSAADEATIRAAEAAGDATLFSGFGKLASIGIDYHRGPRKRA